MRLAHRSHTARVVCVPARSSHFKVISSHLCGILYLADLLQCNRSKKVTAAILLEASFEASPLENADAALQACKLRSTSPDITRTSARP